jgi:hypothetical protein
MLSMKQTRVLDLQNHLIEMINDQSSFDDNSNSADDIQYSALSLTKSPSYVRQTSQISHQPSFKKSTITRQEQSNNSFHLKL